MRNIIQLIWKYYFTLLFLFSELIAFTILVQYNSFQQANFLGFANEVSGGVFDALNETTEYLKLKKINDELVAENADLKNQLKPAFFSLEPRLRYFEDSAYMQQYEYLGGKIVNSTISRRNNFLTINKGNRDSIVPGMGVVGLNGIVGIVKNVSENYCAVMSLLHKDFQLSVRLKNNHYFGLITWDGKDPGLVQLNDIPSHVNLAVGDTVVTRGSSAIFPGGILVGTVKEFDELKGSDFYEINVDLSIDYQSVAYAYLVRNLNKIEQLELEEEFKQEDD